MPNPAAQCFSAATIQVLRFHRHKKYTSRAKPGGTLTMLAAGHTEPPPAASADGLADYEPGAVAGFHALRNLVLASQQMRQAFASRLGVSTTDTFAMGFLADEAPRTARDLAEHLGVAQSSVTAVIDRLERAGLAERRAHPTDRRALIIALTAPGTAAIADLRRATIEALGEAGPRLAADLQQVADSLAEQAERYGALPPLQH
jgi:DNA-binding MarR family transcriptional regulator